MSSDQAESAAIQPNSAPEGLRIEVVELSELRLQPGDVLLLRARYLTQAQVGLIKLRLSQIAPGHEIACISADAELSVIRAAVGDDGGEGPRPEEV